MFVAGVVTLVQLFTIGPVGGSVPIIMGTSSGFIGVFNSVVGSMGGGDVYKRQQLNGYNIVLDTCSSSVHVVDDVAYDIIAMYPEHTADEIVSAMMAKYEMCIRDRDDVEMLEDMVAAAINATVKQVDETAEAEMGKLTGGMNIPGL